MAPTARIEEPIDQPPEPATGFSLFKYGFRPFFFFAGLFGVLSILVWVGVYAGHMGLNLTSPAMLWHAHEMLWGYSAAAIAGFFLTVVPNWTNANAQKGPMLKVLVALWLVGRVAEWSQGSLPYGWVAALDMMFLVALTLVVIKPLTNPQYRRQFVFVPILLCLIVGNAMTHASVLGVTAFDFDWGARGVTLGLDAVLVLIAVMGGRVTPSFTSSFLGHANPNIKVVQKPTLDKAVMAVTWGVLIVDQVWGASVLSGLIYGLAAGLHLWRLVGWQGWRTLSNPLLAVLHLGYLWLVVGFALKGISDFGLFDPASAVHGLTIGAIGTMTLAIMSRASLGHTGRAMKAHTLVVVAYVFLSLAAVTRLSVAICPDFAMELVMASGVLWSLAFLLFFCIYAPILIRPRLDGRPG